MTPYDKDYYSLFERIWGGMEYDIYHWYEKYWSIQLSFAEKANNRRTLSQGHLSPQQLLHKFCREHLDKERSYFKLSKSFFTIPVLYSAPEHREELKTIAINYLEWIKGKLGAIELQIGREYCFSFCFR